MNDEIDGLADRVYRLERQNRGLWIALVAVIVVGAAGGLLSLRGGGEHAAVKTGRLALVDADGTTRASLGVAQGGAVVLDMRDGRDQIRLLLGVNRDGSPLIRMINEYGNPVWKAP